MVTVGIQDRRESVAHVTNLKTTSADMLGAMNFETMAPETAGLIAQIIPVFFLAFILESRSLLSGRVELKKRAYLRRRAVLGFSLSMGFLATLLVELCLLLVVNSGEPLDGYLVYNLWFMAMATIGTFIGGTFVLTFFRNTRR